MSVPNLIAVIGPTASGKTRLGINLAKILNAEIISVDSMQIYRQMDIGTAKPTKQELSTIPHHLIDILEPDLPYNAGLFVRDATSKIDELKRKGKRIILLGGTNLYLKALINGIIDIPDTPQKIKDKIQLKLSSDGVGFCYNWLADLDKKSADKLHYNDVSRIVRALEVILTTGQSICDLQLDHGFKKDRFNVYYLGNQLDRKELYRRINQRVDLMLEQGLMKEVEKLRSNGFATSLPSMNSIGYKQVNAHLNGTLSYQSMVDEIKLKSRRYAKKQLTWCKKISPVNWLEPGFNDWQQLSHQIEKFYQE